VIPPWVIAFATSFAMSFVVGSSAVGGTTAWTIWVCAWIVGYQLVKPPFDDGVRPAEPPDPMRFPRQVERQGAWRGYPG
jgi:hypothetical protein